MCRGGFIVSKSSTHVLMCCVLAPDYKLPKDHCSLVIVLTEATGGMGDLVIHLCQNEPQGCSRGGVTVGRD